MAEYQSVGIIGAGAWGTALAVAARRAGRDVVLWGYERETVEEINHGHSNHIYLPGVTLEPGYPRHRERRPMSRRPISS